ncbi:uncharacterized protein FOMMEDRAFT_25573 [Fomitiporia mediterranea MF3/22]|uniref:uncharacterized protein n=1 Tax=Fomitiporia mediterranea (strain MF3/22) TaxID=694068 RepID=UPI00044080C3|nr:uncharacterized protein FOMMEDRAFT_25573 [Fomitiporia mediterranea MF3/22]EJD08544.1 hypothetical protein FOMMEDRAFT_25573 [Fomitiporia mediterranea MF3/22]
MATLPDSGSGSCTSSPFQVTYPFDKKSNANGTHADLVLRSADGVDFRVMKDVLAVASPVFQDMTTLARPLAIGTKCSTSPSTTDDQYSEEGLPIVVMYESNAVVLDTMLRILYPVVPPKLDSYDVLDGLLRAAQKYDMALVLHVVEESFRRLVDENDGQRAMEVYILAWEYQLEEILRLVLDAFLRYPFNQSYFSGLEKAPASALFRLFDYRQKVSNKVDLLFSPLKSPTDLPQPLRCILREIECSTKNIKPTEGCGSNENGYYIDNRYCKPIQMNTELYKKRVRPFVMDRN